MENRTVLVTGAAGFIGAALTAYLLQNCPEITVVGVDNLNDYYDVSLKKYRLSQIEEAAKAAGSSGWVFEKGNIADADFVSGIFKRYCPQIVVNLAAQAGVRYSIDYPDIYMESNVMGFYRILEACRHSRDGKKEGVQHLIYASSSSVYGNNEKVPYSTADRVDEPVSLYAATKKSNELLAYSYSKLYGIPTTGLRFFTVYGPAGRPDMAYFAFADKLKNGETIRIFNYGNCERDFTYIDDIVEGIARVMQSPPVQTTGEDGLPVAPYSLYNIGNAHPVNLMDFVKILAEELIRSGVLPADFDLTKHYELVPMQPGDVKVTYADVDPLEKAFGFKPQVTLQEGLHEFSEWYARYENGITG